MYPCVEEGLEEVAVERKKGDSTIRILKLLVANLRVSVRQELRRGREVERPFMDIWSDDGEEEISERREGRMEGDWRRERRSQTAAKGAFACRAQQSARRSRPIS